MKAIAAMVVVWFACPACALAAGASMPSSATAPASAPAPAASLDAYGDPLPAGATARYGTARLMHQSFPWSAILAPDKSVFATADQQGGLYVWDTRTGQRLWLQHETNRSVATMAFSPDGSLLAAAGWHAGLGFRGRFLMIYDARTGKPIQTIDSNNPNQQITAMLFSPDGSKLITAENTINVFGVPKGDLLAQYKGVTGIMTLAISPDGNTLAAGGMGNDVPVCLWDLTTGKDRRIALGGQYISSLAFSPDGLRLAASVTQWYEQTKPEPNKPPQSILHPAATIVTDLATGKKVGAIENHQVLQFLPDGKSFFSCVQSPGTGQFVLHQVDTQTWKGRNLGMSVSDRQHSTSQILSADGTMLVSIAQQAVLRVRTVPDGNSVFPGPPKQGAVRKLAVSPDGTRVAIANSLVSRGAASEKEEIPAVMIYDATGVFLRGLDGGTMGACDVDFSRDGKLLAAAGGDGLLRLWNTADWSPAKAHDAAGPINTGTYNRVLAEIQFVRDGRLLTLSRDAKVALLDSGTGQFVGDRAAYDPNYAREASVAASPLARVTAIMAGWRVILWDATKGAALGDEIDPPAILNDNSVRISPDGLLLAVSGANDSVFIFELATRRPVRTLRASGANASSAVFSPDGRLLAAASGEGRGAYLWNLKTGKELAALRGHEQHAACVAFTPDGRGLLTGSYDNTALRWDISRYASPAPPPQDLDHAWNDLADLQGSAAWAAQKTFLAAGTEGAARLADRVKPLVADRDAVAKWIVDLDSEEFKVRQDASASLADISDMILPQLKAALAGTYSAEVKTRLGDLIDRAGSTQAAGGDRLRLLRACWLLQLIGGDDAKRGLAKLAAAPDPSRITRDAKAALAALEK